MKVFIKKLLILNLSFLFFVGAGSFNKDIESLKDYLEILKEDGISVSDIETKLDNLKKEGLISETELLRIQDEILNLSKDNCNNPPKSAPMITGGPDSFGYMWMAPVPYTGLGGPWTLVPTTPITGYYDYEVIPFDLPFPFKFYGNVYNRVHLSVNGVMLLSDVSYLVPVASNYLDRNFYLPTSVLNIPAICPYWDDLFFVGDAPVSSRLYYRTGFFGPYSAIEFLWSNIPTFSFWNRPGSPLSFSVTLVYDGSIIFYYIDVVAFTYYLSYGRSATAGIQDLYSRARLGNKLVYSYNSSTLYNGLSVVFAPPPDADGDAIPDNLDNCPSVPNFDQADVDNDGIGNLCDNCYHHPRRWPAGNPPFYPLSEDVYNPLQQNSDGDTWGDACDNCPYSNNNPQNDVDFDGVGNGCDNCFHHPRYWPAGNPPTYPVSEDIYNPWLSGDDPCVAGIQSVYQLNSDCDSWGDACDNCDFTTNNPQGDGDNDGVGGACDNCPSLYNPAQSDIDVDGQGDDCDPCPADPTNADADGDNVCDMFDNCLGVANNYVAGDNPCTAPVETQYQKDLDCDGQGDDCDACSNDSYNDWDNDGVCGDVDNCPWVSNPGQADSDGDGYGDVCDPYPASFASIIPGIYPNPFVSNVIINIEIKQPSFSNLSIFDASGKLIRNIGNLYLDSGIHSFSWDGKTDDGFKSSAGIYFFKVSTKNGSIVFKLIKTN